MTADYALSVVVPAFNEARRLPATLREIAGFLAAEGSYLPAEIIIVDDGSTDGTQAVAREAGGSSAGVEVRAVRLDRNRGKGAAVRAGLQITRGARVLVCDADLATPIGELAVLSASSADVAVGSRALRRELISVRQPLRRDYLGRLFNLYVRCLSLTRLRDTQCGFKLLDGAIARTLAPRLRLERFAFDIELLARAERLGASVVEVPVRWRHVAGSRVHPLRDGMRMGWDALRLRWWLSTGA